jgi:hypothetical protein
VRSLGGRTDGFNGGAVTSWIQTFSPGVSGSDGLLQLVPLRSSVDRCAVLDW